MQTLNTFYIDGHWVEPSAGSTLVDIVDPATETLTGRLTMGTAQDADRAVAAARAAFPHGRNRAAPNASRCSSGSSNAIARGSTTLLKRSASRSARRSCCASICRPRSGSRSFKPPWRRCGISSSKRSTTKLRATRSDWRRGTDHAVELAVEPDRAPRSRPALAAGCTIVLKPSEIAPLDALIFAEIMHEAGAPPGVFNMIFGDGRSSARRRRRIPIVDMVSITGSTRAGVEVAISAAPTVKRVAQELGGKSALLILDDADLQSAVTSGVAQCMVNSGQTCIAPTRMLVPRDRYEDAVRSPRRSRSVRVGDPSDPATKMGPSRTARNMKRCSA